MIVAVHYVVARAVVVVEQVVYLAGPAQFQVPVRGVLPAVVVFVVAAVIVVDGVVAVFVDSEVVVELVDVVVVIVAVVPVGVVVVEFAE